MNCMFLASVNADLHPIRFPPFGPWRSRLDLTLTMKKSFITIYSYSYLWAVAD